MSVIVSKDNLRVQRWRKLVQDARLRRREGRALIEGEHLIAALLDSGGKPEELLLSKTGAERFEIVCKRAGRTPVHLADSVFKSIVDVETPSGIAAEIALPAAGSRLQSASSCVFMDRIQDAGNVGAIMRSAAAFGIRHAVLSKGCADAWSPKVLRAGMGAHFSMIVLENADLPAAMAEFGGKTACTVPRGGAEISTADLSGRIGWIFGAEGQGVSAALNHKASLKLTIPMPGVAESLNVAAAAAICFYELSRRAARS